MQGFRAGPLYLFIFMLACFNPAYCCHTKQEALLMQRNRASTLSVEIVQNAAQMFDGLHLERLQPVNDLQGHSRSLPLLLFNRPYSISC